VNAAAVQEQLIDELLDKVEEQKCRNAPLMNRVEQMLSTKEQVERYVELLLRKLQAEKHMDYPTLDRVDRLLGMLTTLERQETQPQ
jgi:hypothetical protein